MNSIVNIPEEIIHSQGKFELIQCVHIIGHCNENIALLLPRQPTEGSESVYN